MHDVHINHHISMGLQKCICIFSGISLSKNRNRTNCRLPFWRVKKVSNYMRFMFHNTFIFKEEANYRDIGSESTIINVSLHSSTARQRFFMAMSSAVSQLLRATETGNWKYPSQIMISVWKLIGFISLPKKFFLCAATTFTNCVAFLGFKQRVPMCGSYHGSRNPQRYAQTRAIARNQCRCRLDFTNKNIMLQR